MMRIRGTIPLSLLICILFVSACQPAAPSATPTVVPVIPQPSEIPPTSAPTTIPSQPTPFPLNGTWIGAAQNGNITLPIMMEIKTACKAGEVCGTFNLMSVPCSGNYKLVNELNGVYEFRAGDFQGTCGKGKDTLALLEDGTLQYTSIGDYGETKGVLDRVMPVIYDDDGSPDGTVALMYLLSDPRVSIKAVNISYGEAYPATYIQYIGGLLDSLGFSNIPLGAGQNTPPAGGNDFPKSLKDASNAFWGMPIANKGKTYPVTDAAALIVSTLHSAPEPYTLFISGPLTNLAAALRLDPQIKEHIKTVFIMGGAVFTHGNLDDLQNPPDNYTAEWNIYVDPQAAAEVFNSGLDIHLVPLDATNQVKIGYEDTAKWRTGGPQAIFAANLYDSLLKNAPSNKMAIWDIMTAEIMIKQYLCAFQDLNIKVITTPGSMNGQTDEQLNETPNAHVCIDPIPGEIRFQLDNMFSISH